MIFWTGLDFCIISDCMNTFSNNLKNLWKSKKNFNPANTQFSSEESGMCSLFTWLNMQILNLCHRWNRLKVVNYFCKTLHLRCLTGFWIRLRMTNRDLTDRVNVCYCESQVFLWFYQQFEIKAKLKQFRTLFLRNLLTAILDTNFKRFHSGFFELEKLEIFTTHCTKNEVFD